MSLEKNLKFSVVKIIKKSLQIISCKRFFFSLPRRNTMLLTFDDSIGCDVEGVLTTLRLNNIKAIFFLTGKYIANNYESVKKAHLEGHYIANHTYYHEDITAISLHALYKTLQDTKHEINKVTGVSNRLFRPPFGKLSFLSLLFCLLMGYRVVLWSLEGGEFKGSDKNEIVKNLFKNKSDNKNDIVVLHLELRDTYLVLENIIKLFLKDGIVFVPPYDIFTTTKVGFLDK